MATTLRILSIALFSFGASVQAADSPAPAPAPIRIGFICSLTGGSQDFTTAARLGAELAVSEINEVGGYFGRPVVLVTRDDKASPDEGRKIAEELVVQKQADFTVGFCTSGVAMKSLDIFQDHKHLLMVPVATGTAITAKYPPASSYVFRMSPRDSLQAAFLIDQIVSRGLTRVAVFADKTNYGEGGLKDLQARLADRGLAPVRVTRVEPGTTSLTQEMLAAKAAGATAVIGYALGAEQATIARAHQEAHMAAPLFGSWTMSFHSVLEKAGPAVAEAAMPQTFIQSVMFDRRATFLARLRHVTGNRQAMGSLMAAAQTYDAVHLMVRAVFQTRGDTSGDALKYALEHLDHGYTGVVTTYDKPFSGTDHDAISANMLWMGVWRGGEIRFVNQDDEKRAAMIPRKAL
jgi:branched-chain amino acid transport system substrate-binding protein